MVLSLIFADTPASYLLPNVLVSFRTRVQLAVRFSVLGHLEVLNRSNSLVPS
jgi:hypothetical protein